MHLAMDGVDQPEGANQVMQRISLIDFQPRSVLSPLSGVDIWRIPVEVQTFKLAGLARLLSSSERDQVDMAAQHSGYRRFIVTRSFLRLILASYLDVTPEEISFHYGAAGKPRLDGEFAETGLNFNLSYSGGIALVVVSSNRHVGVDIECLKFGRAISELIAQSLTERERQKWSNAIPSGRRKVFYRYWVRKEAYLKGVGSGLTSPIHRVDVSNSNPLGNHLVTTPVSDGFECPWKIYDLQIPGSDDVVAALAIENGDPVNAARVPGIEPKSTSAGVRAGKGRIQCLGTRSLNTSAALRCNRI